MPVATPVTTPEDNPMVATVVKLLSHVPPVVALLSSLVDPSQISSVPAIGSGCEFTVTTVVRAHPVASV
jgi:hypothetical protein